VLADPDLLTVLHRQRHDLARVVVGQREVAGAAALHHDQRQPRHLAVPRARIAMLDSLVCGSVQSSTWWEK
jgi:hypothetical protein